MIVGTEHDGIASAEAKRGNPTVVLIALTFVYVLNFLDRQLLGILAKPIQDELQISDGQACPPRTH